jgi:hypothetical protein
VKYERKTPCPECPFRKASWAGYLGDNEVHEFIEPIVAQQPTECHMGVNYEDRAWRDKLDETKACAGAAQFLANSMSRPRDEEYAAYVKSLGPNPAVFQWSRDFIAHHDNDTNRRFVAMAGPRNTSNPLPPAEPEQNALQCFDEDVIYQGETGDECPEDPGHAVEPVHVSATPLGRPDDEDNYHYGLSKWVYDLADQ